MPDEPLPPADLPVPPGAPPGYEGYGITASTPAAGAPAPSGPPGAGVDAWVVRLADGSGARLTGPALVGRNPDPELAPPGARLLAVDDPARTVSRSHLVAVPTDDGGLELRNVSSVNALIVAGSDGVERKIEPGDRVVLTESTRVLIGAYPVDVGPDRADPGDRPDGRC